MILSEPNNYAQLNDLNIDCLLMIFEKLDFLSLLIMSEMSENTRVAAADIYRRKFSHLAIAYRRVFWGRELYVSDHIEIPNWHWASRVIRSFGEFILKFEIHFGGNETHITEDVFELVHRRCKSLKYLDLETVTEHALNRISEPFVSVENVKLHINYTHTENQALSFKEMFPNMQSLKLDFRDGYKNTSVIDHYPHLKHFGVDMYSFDGVRAEIIQKIVELNPQIRSMYMKDTKYWFLRFIGKKLVDLERLEVRSEYGPRYPWNETVAFPKVTSLTVYSSENIAKMTFERIRYLELTCYEISSHDWAKFMKRHPTLTHFNGTLNSFDKDDHRLCASISTIAETMPNLEFAIIVEKLEVPNGIENIRHFLQTSDKLQTLELIFKSKVRPHPRLGELRNRIQDNWQVTGTPKGCLIQRKNEVFEN